MEEACTLDTCAVCCASLGPTGCFTTDCCHVFHAPCLERWVVQLAVQGVDTPTCPSCRSILTNAPGMVAVRHAAALLGAPMYTPPLPLPRRRLSAFSARYPYPPRDGEPVILSDVCIANADINTDALDPSFVEVSLACNVAEVPHSQTTEVTVLATLQFQETNTTTPVDFVVLMDVSGSMDGAKLRAAKTALVRVSDMFNTGDRVTLVAFDDMPMQLTPLAPLSNPAYNAEFKRAARTLESGGGTNIFDALKCAFDILKARTYKNPLCHVLLFTDGQDCLEDENLNRLTEASDAAGSPSWSAFGFGADHDAILLSRIVTRGFGSFSFIEESDSDAMDEVFAAFAMDATRVAACSVTLSLEGTPPETALVSVNGACVTDVHLGNVAAGCTQEFLIKMTVEPANFVGSVPALRARVTGRRTPLDDERVETDPVTLVVRIGSETVQSDVVSVARVTLAGNAAVLTETTRAFAAALESGCTVDDAMDILDQAAVRLIGPQEAAHPFIERLKRMREDAGTVHRDILARRATQAHTTGTTQRSVSYSPYVTHTPSAAASNGVHRARTTRDDAHE